MNKVSPRPSRCRDSRASFPEPVAPLFPPLVVVPPSFCGGFVVAVFGLFRTGLEVEVVAGLSALFGREVRNAPRTSSSSGSCAPARGTTTNRTLSDIRKLSAVILNLISFASLEYNRGFLPQGLLMLNTYLKD